MFLTKRDNSIVKNIILGLCTALFFSAFLYLEYFGISNKYINSITALMAIFMLLTIPKKALFFSGFFIGILWFYWVSYSFYYYDLLYLTPLIVLGMGLAYGLIFYLLSFKDKTYIRAILLFLLSFLSLFNFDWLKPELLLVDSIFYSDKAHYFLIIASILMFIELKTLRYLFLIPLMFSINTDKPYESETNLKIYMPTFSLGQIEKWDRNNLEKIVINNIEEINHAIKEKYDLVVLPETAFPMILNHDKYLIDFLKTKSKDIDIITGALQEKDSLMYNSSYFFSQGELQIANKVVLVPFGEAVPLPQKIRDFINNTFYNGAKDYEKALKPSDFNIKGEKFRNAICYEATSEEIYKKLDGTKNIIAISNLAWFTPSIMPTLQKYLMKYYTKKHGVRIYHVVNRSDNFVITP